MAEFPLGPSVDDSSSDGVAVCPYCGRTAHAAAFQCNLPPGSDSEWRRAVLHRLLEASARFDYNVDSDTLRVRLKTEIGLSASTDELASRLDRVVEWREFYAPVSRPTWSGRNLRAASMRLWKSFAIVVDAGIEALARYLTWVIPFGDRREQVERLRRQRLDWRLEGRGRVAISRDSLVQVVVICWPVLAWVAAGLLWAMSRYGFALLLVAALLGSTGHAVFRCVYQSVASGLSRFRIFVGQRFRAFERACCVVDKLGGSMSNQELNA